MRERCLLRWLCWLGCLIATSQAAAQPVQFSQPTTIPPPPGFGGSSTIAQPSVGTGSTLATPFSPYATTPPSSSPFVTPQFGTAGSTPGFNASPPSLSVPPAPATSSPFTTTPNSFFPNSNSSTFTNPFSGFGSSAVPSNEPGVFFPNGFMAEDSWAAPVRLLQHPRFSDTWVYGDGNPNDVQIHDFEFAVTGAIPNFFGSTQPLFITPTFMLHLWDGPSFMPADLPPNAYSAFLDFFWASDPNRRLGAEFGVAVGAYTDFNTFNSHSIRVTGEGFGVMRLTETLTFKFGVWYLNRNDLKLLPAGGLVWEPNPQTKLNLLFPNPKFSRYLTTVGTTEYSWYVAGEYGGGAWTIERTDGSSDRVDINDIRVKLGIDWINQRYWRGYFEVGYVCDRQVVYVVDPSDSFTAKNTFLLGGGFAF